MDEHHRGVALACIGVVALLGVACGDDEEAAQPAARSRATADAGAKRDAGAPIYDRRGELVPGGLVLGVEVPRALRRSGGSLERESGRSVTLRGSVPMDRVLRFLQRRLTTGQVETGPNGARFVDATPRPPGDGTKKVSVWVYADSRNETRVVIFDRTSRPGPTPTDEEVAREFQTPANNQRRPGTE